MVLAILAVIAAITAVIVYWDELVVLFTETIPQFIEQNAALADSFNGVSGMFYDMCQFMVTNWTTHSGSLLLAFSTFITGMEELWNQLTTTVVEPAMAVIGELLDNVWEQHLHPLWDKTTGFILSVCETLMILWNRFLKPIVEWVNSIMAPIIVATIQTVAGVVEWVVGVLSRYLGELVERLDGVVQYIAGVFTGDWERAWGGIQKTFKEICDHLADPLRAPINGIIGLINGLMSGVVTGINLVIKALNQLHFDFPDWVPGLGGKSFGFNLKTITAPQIPLLAKGAVLPANKPFLAVVGDQKHGTNVEAPLATIQEAVALVMGDQISAMMAGFEALLQEQRAIRQTVEGIQIGDTVIGRAAQRYNQKMAIMKGGY